jgi:pseudomonalisin
LYWAASDGANFLSALGYIPEGAWNDPLDSKGNPQFAATGGGVSIYMPTPSWQTGPGVPGSQGRYIPDVSFAASSREPYFSCVAASGGSCVLDSMNGFTFIGAGGTSASTPSMAAITALLDESQGAAQGNLNPRLYALADTASDGVFHDVTIASSGVSGCTVSIPSLCNNSTPGPTGLTGGLAGYLVGNGFDEATGLGSIDVGKLVSNWSTTQASGVDLDQFGVTGSWYNQATSGQGFEINVIPDLYGPGQGLFFAGWFTYDVTAPGGRRWYSVTGQVSSTNSVAALQIYDTEGGIFASPPSVPTHGVLGSATFSMSDCDTASFTYQFTDGSGRSGTIPITRIAPNITCGTSGDNGAASSDYLLSGSWYDPTESGQGFLLDINPTINFFGGAWYTFVRSQNGVAVSGPQSQDWFTFGATNFFNGNSSLTGIPIVESTGGIFNNTTPITRSQVGTIDITFQSCTSMTWSYTFTSGANAGLSGSIPLTRIGPAPAGCAL